MEGLNMSPLDPPREFDSAMFFAMLEKHPNVSAIVSFVGTPPLTDEEIRRLVRNIPKLIVADTARAGLKTSFEEGVIHLGIIRRPGIGEKAFKPPKTLRQYFDQVYTVVTPETASSALP